MCALVLLVEDNPTNLELMEYLLRAFGHTTLTARDGREGVNAAKDQTPDVILMDLQMPTLNGYDAAAEIKRVPTLRHVPIVAVTALAMVGDRDKILAHGFDGYIAKPISPEHFVHEVEGFVRAPAKTRATPTPVHVPAIEISSGARQPVRHMILVVDNTLANLYLATSTFEPFGYQVFTAKSVNEGLEIARAHRPDIILSDVHMSVLSGFDFLRIVREDAALCSIPFVLISSSVWGEADRQRGLLLGADRFVLRPLEPQALLAEIENCLSVTRGMEDSDGNNSRR